MSNLSSRLSLPYLMPSQAQKHVTHNEALQRLDQIVQLVLVENAAETPPDTPGEGSVYGLGNTPTGVWAGQGGGLAAYEAGAWHFLTPQPGWLAWDLSRSEGQGALLCWSGSAWEPAEADQRALLGIGTSADAQNLLAVAGPATLLSHGGAGHQLKINKASSSDTASLLFQSNWQGRAEIGLTGDDSLTIKVSEDGGSWLDALKIDSNTGNISGSAVQSSPGDTSAGRLMRADYGYGPGNLIGAVAQVGGTPTGAVLEQGETADGAWLRLADGTQVVWAERASGSSWSFPQPFVVAPMISVSATGTVARMTSVSARAPTGATPHSYASDGSEQTGEALCCMALGRWV